MRPVARQRSVTMPMTPARTSSESLRIAASSPLTTVSLQENDYAPQTDVILSPTGFETPRSTCAPHRTERQLHLAVAIRQRIESRLGGRVHDLSIRIRGNIIMLEGHCATYYTKQLAQHAALGVLEDEQLENAIVVTM